MNNHIKILLLVVLAVSLATLAMVVFKKNKVVLEGEDGKRLYGYSGKTGVDSPSDTEPDSES